METRRSFFGKLAAVAAAIVSFPSSLSSGEPGKRRPEDILLAKDTGRHYDAIIYDDLWQNSETGEIIEAKDLEGALQYTPGPKTIIATPQQKLAIKKWAKQIETVERKIWFGDDYDAVCKKEGW